MNYHAWPNHHRPLATPAPALFLSSFFFSLLPFFLSFFLSFSSFFSSSPALPFSLSLLFSDYSCSVGLEFFFTVSCFTAVVLYWVLYSNLFSSFFFFFIIAICFFYFLFFYSFTYYLQLKCCTVQQFVSFYLIKFSRTVEIYLLDISAHPKINSWLRPWSKSDEDWIILFHFLEDDH